MPPSPEVLACQRNDFLIVCDRGQDIDESKQLCLEAAVLHGQVDGRLRPPAALEESRRPTCRETGELFTDTIHGGFERGRHVWHLHPTGSETEEPCQYTL